MPGIFGPMRQNTKQDWLELHDEDPNNSYSSPVYGCRNQEGCENSLHFSWQPEGKRPPVSPRNILNNITNISRKI